MRYVSLCDGIGAVHLAWQPLGWQCAWVSEIEPFCNAVVKHHWGFPNLGDMTKITEADIERHGAIDLVVGGTPCQSFSVAGLRKGLGDPRGNLALRFCQLVAATRPGWVLWENVPGVLSANGGSDLQVFFQGMAECGYFGAWRILDAQYFGVPQRRRRVFAVFCPGDWRRAAAVLFERDSLCGYPPPSREAGAGVAHCLARGSCGSHGRYDPNGETFVAPPLTAGYAKSAFNDGKRGVDPMVIPIHNPGLMDRDSNRDGAGIGESGAPMFSLQARPRDAIAFDCKQSGQGGEVSPPLRALNYDKSHANAGGQVAVAFLNTRFRCRTCGRGFGVNDYDSNVVTCPQCGETHINRIDDMLDEWDASELEPGAAMAVRRLTPRECERLQGFPDDYTAIEYRKKPAADGPRYRALGNSMAVPVVRWIGERIAMVDALTTDP